MNQYFRDIQTSLQREFYADNFREIAALAKEAAQSADDPLPFFVIWKLFDSLDLTWRERPLTVATADRMRKHLLPSLENYISAAQSGISPELEVEHLNGVIRALLSWLDIQREIPWSQ